MHVHVTKASADAKLWLEPDLKEVYFVGFTVREQREIMQIAKENYNELKHKWNEYFSK